MKRLLLLIVSMVALAVSVSASSLTVSSQTIPNVFASGLTSSSVVTMRVYASKPFLSNDSPPLSIASGSPNGGGSYYLQLTCAYTSSSGTIVVPAFSLPCAGDALAPTSGITSTWSFYIFVNGAQLQPNPIAYMAGIQSPAPPVRSHTFCSPANSCVDWVDLQNMSFGVPISSPNQTTYNIPQINNLLAALSVGSGGAPTGDTYILQTPDLAHLPASQALNQFAVGAILKLANSSGVIAVAVRDTDLQNALTVSPPLVLTPGSTIDVLSLTTSNLALGSNLSFSAGTGTGVLAGGTGATIALGPNVVTAFTNDTNLSVSGIAAGNATLAWLGQLSPARGGSGVNNGAFTNTLSGNFATSGAFPLTLTVTASTNVTVPPSGTLLSTATTTLGLNTLNMGTGGTTTGIVNLFNASGANATGLEAGASAPATTYILPTSNPTVGQVLTAAAPSGGFVQTSWGSVAVGSVNWNSIGNPTGNQALSMGADTSTWTWTILSGTSNGLSLTDGGSDTGTGYLASLITASGSTLNVLQAQAQGVNQLTISAVGLTTIRNLALSNALATTYGGLGANLSAASGVVSLNAGAEVSNTITANGVAYGGASNVVNFTSAVNSGVLTTSSGGVPAVVAPAGDLTVVSGVLDTVQPILLTSTPQFAGLGLGTSAPSGGMISAGQVVTNQSSGTIVGIDSAANFIANTTSPANYIVDRIRPTFNFGVSNTTKTVTVLSIDTINTNVTGLPSINLIQASYGGAQQFLVDYQGDVTATGTVSAANAAFASNVALGTPGVQTGTLTLNPIGSGFGTTFQSGTVGAARTLVFPAADPLANQVLTAAAPVAGVINLAWATVSGGGGPNVVLNNQANTYASGNQNFSAVSITIPVGPGMQPTVSGQIAYDSTASLYGGGFNGSYSVFSTPSETETLTNKTFSTASNTFSIGSQSITAVSGNTVTVGTVTGSFTNGDCLSIDASGNIKDAGVGACSGSSGTSVAWSSLLNPSTNLSLAMALNTSTFTTSGNVTAAPWIFQDTTGNTDSTIPLFWVRSQGTSTAPVWEATAKGNTNGIQVNASGQVVALGTGGVTVASLVGTITSGNLPAAIVYNNQSNTITTGLQDLSGATFKVPNSSGASPTTSALIAYNTTNNQFVGGVNGTDTQFLMFGPNTQTSSIPLTLTGTAVSGGSGLVILSPGNHTAVTTNTNDVKYNGSTITVSNTTLAEQDFWLIGQPTINGSAAGKTVTTASTFTIAGPPIVGTNTPTFTNGPYALWVQSGITELGGNLSLGSNAELTVIANAGTTGTTTSKLVKLTGAPSTAVISSTTDTGGILGVAVSGAGTTGSASIAIHGQASCIFENTTVAGDYVTIGSSTAGDCHDAGSTYPSSGQVLGRVLASGSAGTYTVDFFGPELQASTAASVPTISAWVFPWGFGDPGNTGSAVTVIFSANNIVYSYILTLQAQIVVNSVTFEVVGTAASSNGSVAIYNLAGTTKLIDTGAVSTTTNGIKATTLGTPVTLPAGNYRLAITDSVDTATFLGSSIVGNGTAAINTINSGTYVYVGSAANSSSGGVCPSTLGTITAVNTINAPIIKLQ